MFEEILKQSTSFKKLQSLLSVMTGNDIEEILPESHLEDDLGLILEEDLDRILGEINQVFGIKIHKEDVLKTFEDSSATIEQLAKLIDDEVELG